MEKRNYRDTDYNAAPQNNWQNNHEGDWQLDEINAGETASLLTTDSDDPDYDEPLYASDDAENEENDEEKDDNEENEEEENDDSDADWGNIDPQSQPNHPGPPDPMDPSGPGSAV